MAYYWVTPTGHLRSSYLRTADALEFGQLIIGPKTRFALREVLSVPAPADLTEEEVQCALLERELERLRAWAGYR